MGTWGHTEGVTGRHFGIVLVSVSVEDLVFGVLGFVEVVFELTILREVRGCMEDQVGLVLVPVDPT